MAHQTWQISSVQPQRFRPSKRVQYIFGFPRQGKMKAILIFRSFLSISFAESVSATRSPRLSLHPPQKPDRSPPFSSRAERHSSSFLLPHRNNGPNNSFRFRIKNSENRTIYPSFLSNDGANQLYYFKSKLLETMSNESSGITLFLQFIAI